MKIWTGVVEEIALKNIFSMQKDEKSDVKWRGATGDFFVIKCSYKVKIWIMICSRYGFLDDGMENETMDFIIS